MKHIKEYKEHFNLNPSSTDKYKKDDYVFINYKDISVPFGQVKNIKRFKYSDPDYYVEIIDNNKIITHRISEYFLSRKMTKKEIEEFEAIKSSMKYNI